MKRKFDMMANNRNRADLLARLEPYWKMEAANAVCIPMVILLLSEARLGWISLVPMAAMILMLIIGAAYWRGKVRHLQGASQDWDGLLDMIGRARVPALILTIVGCAAAAAGWIDSSLARGTADRVTASGCAILALLEYVNYYHRQLQHFDNRADFKRMLAGKGFRRSWMARDLAERARRA